jgi:hypothetical protein
LRKIEIEIAKKNKTAKLIISFISVNLTKDLNVLFESIASAMTAIIIRDHFTAFSNKMIVVLMPRKNK